jgi:hypothetical protein
MSEIEILKKELKTWENDFKKINGRAPTKEDIKANREIGIKSLQFTLSMIIFRKKIQTICSSKEK